MRNAILAALILGLATPSAPAQNKQWAEKMFSGGLTHDFGTHPHGAQLVHRFTITNIYAVRMDISSVKSGCGCVTAEAEKTSLEPRESTDIIVRMDARRFTGPKTVGVRVSVGPEFRSSAELRVTANSRPDVVFNPGEVNFGSVPHGTSPTQTIDVEYAGMLDWKVNEAIAKDMPFEVSVSELYRRMAADGKNRQVGYQLKVTLKSDAPVGAVRNDIFLKTNDPGSPVVSVMVEASVQSAITVSPASLSLGAIKTDAPQTRRVVVRGTKSFHITGIDGLGDGVELNTPLTTTDALNQPVTIKIQPSAAGEFRKTLKIKTTLQDTPVTLTLDASVMK
jgi:Protein of unknown function (DUF1573)